MGWHNSQRVRVARRGQKKEKREAAARDALADAAASLQQSPRPAPGRPPRAGMPTKEPTQARTVSVTSATPGRQTCWNLACCMQVWLWALGKF